MDGFLFHGVLVKKLERKPRKYLHESNKKCNIEGWVKLAQIEIWDFSHDIWVWRNKIKHGGTPAEIFVIKNETEEYGSSQVRYLEPWGEFY